MTQLENIVIMRHRDKKIIYGYLPNIFLTWSVIL